jgi:hypothetical protein
MVGRIFYSIHYGCFNGLIIVREFFHAFVIGVLYNRKPLWIAGLSGTLNSNFARIIPQLVRSCFVPLWTPFFFAVFAHTSS